MTAEEYRRNAGECLALARYIGNPERRARIMGAAQAWLSLAEQAEKNARTDLTYETPERTKT
jgi:hypothetical protein